MSTRLNDIANEINDRAHELAKTPALEIVSRALHEAAELIRAVDRAVDDGPAPVARSDALRALDRHRHERNMQALGYGPPADRHRLGHAPVVDLGVPRLVGCSCDKWTPSGVPGSDPEDEFAQHVASARQNS